MRLFSTMWKRDSVSHMWKEAADPEAVISPPNQNQSKPISPT